MLWGCTALLLLAAAVHSDPQPLRCPTGVSSFSASHRPAHFYSCKDSTMAVLMECPPGQVYHGYTQRCRGKDEKEDPKPFDEKAMGRYGIVLGALYNGRKNVFDTKFLWNDDTIQEFKFKYDRKETTTSFSTDTRTEDRVDKFDISADLKMDFMNGQVKVHGAMRYLTDEVHSEKELNVQLMYHTTKYTETFPKYIPKDHPELCGGDYDYTHVVTSVTYGIDVNLVFKYLLADTESIENIYGMLDLTITAIPGLAIEGSGEVNLTSSQKEMLESVDIKLYGDGSIPPAVTTYQQALDLYRELPSYAGTAANNYSGSTILDVHYTPITDICTDADYVLNAINNDLVNQITLMLTEIELLGVKVKGLLARKATQDLSDPTFATQFRPIGDSLDEFKKKWAAYQLDVKDQLKKIIPNIRGGDGTGEDALAMLFQEHADSVFAFDRSNQFLMWRNREISAVFHLTQSFPTDKDEEKNNIVMFDYLAADDVDLFLQNPYVVVLELRILTPMRLTENFLNGEEESEEGFWFNDFETNGLIGSLVRNLSRFAWENHESETQGYLVKLEEITDGSPGIQVQTWVNEIEKDNFVIPTAPEQPTVYHISYDSIKLDVKYFSEVATKARVYVTNAFDVTNEFVKDFPFDQPGESITIEFDGLEAITLYTVTVKYVTVFGLSPPSPASLQFITAPSSPPSDLRVSYTTSQLTVSWSEPADMGIVNETMIQKDDLSYSISINGMNGYSETKLFTKPTLTCTFDELQDATKYNIEARTFFKEENTNQTLKPPVRDDPTTTTTTTTLPTLSTRPPPRGLHTRLSMTSVSLPSSIVSYTNPTSPVMLPPFPGEVGLNSMTVRWEGPFRMPEGASDISFVLAYATVDDDDNYGDFTEVSSAESNKVIDELTKNTKYAFKVRVVTNVGSSDFSSLLAIRTKDDQTDLGKFEEEVMDMLDSLKEEAKKKSIVCAYKETFDPDNSNIITYSKVFVESDNIGGTMNPSTGIFKAGASGSYMISTSMEMELESGQTHSIVMQQQGKDIAESRMTGICNEMSFSGFYDNGSKNIVVELATGDEINLYASTSKGMDLKNIVFCVQSLKVNKIVA